jgi:hypothetical protein
LLEFFHCDWQFESEFKIINFDFFAFIGQDMKNNITNIYLLVLGLFFVTSAMAGGGRFFTGDGDVHRVTIRPLQVLPQTNDQYEMKFGIYAGKTDLVLHVQLINQSNQVETIDGFYDVLNHGAIWHGNVDDIVYGDGFSRVALRTERNVDGLKCAMPRFNGYAIKCYVDLDNGFVVAIDGTNELVNIEAYDFRQSLARFKNALMGQESAGAIQFPVALFQGGYDRGDALAMLDKIDSLEGLQYAFEAGNNFTDQNGWSSSFGRTLKHIKCIYQTRSMLSDYLLDGDEKHVKDVLDYSANCSMSVVPVFSQFFELTSAKPANRMKLVKAFENYANKYQNQTAACVAKVIQNSECKYLPVVIAARPGIKKKTVIVRNAMDSAKESRVSLAEQRNLIDEEMSNLKKLLKNPFSVFGVSEEGIKLTPKDNALATFSKMGLQNEIVPAKISLFQKNTSPLKLKYGSYVSTVYLSFKYLETRACIIPACNKSTKLFDRPVNKSLQIEISPRNSFSNAEAVSIFSSEITPKDAQAYKVTYSNVVMTVTGVSPALM